MLDEEKLINDATKAIEKIEGYGPPAKQTAVLIHQALDEHGMSLEAIKDVMDKASRQSEKQRKEVKEAIDQFEAMCKLKTPRAVAAAKKLQPQLRAADDGTGYLHVNLGPFKALWDKAAAAEKALRTELQGTGEAARKATQALQASRRDMENQLGALQKQLSLARSAQPAATAGGPPSSGSSATDQAASKNLGPVLKDLTVTAKASRGHIDTAIEACKAIDTALKNKDDAYGPDVVKQAQANSDLGDALAKLVGTTRSLLSRAIEAIKEGKDLLALVG